jgi:hypothetical protein
MLTFLCLSGCSLVYGYCPDSDERYAPLGVDPEDEWEFGEDCDGDDSVIIHCDERHWCAEAYEATPGHTYCVSKVDYFDWATGLGLGSVCQWEMTGEGSAQECHPTCVTGP